MVILKIIVILLALVGIVGSIVPALPGPPLSWLALLFAFFFKGTNGAGEEMSLIFLLVWLGITVLVTILDYFVPAYMTKKAGGHRAASIGATIGLLAGIFLSPAGMILCSLAGAFLGEFLFENAGMWNSFKASIGAFLGFITGTFLKLACSGILLYFVIVYLW